VIDQQFGAVLGWLGGWSDDALEHMRRLHEAGGSQASDPQQERTRKRAELARRKANLSRQHEIGLIDDAQLIARLGEIRTEEAQLNSVQIHERPLWNETLQAIRAFESLGAQWDEAANAREEGLCHRMAFALVEEVHLDLLQERIVGVQPKPDIFLPMQGRLEQHGWYEKTQGLLWSDNPTELGVILKRTRYDDVLDALQSGLETIREIADHVGIDYRNAHAYIRRMVREGIVVSQDDHLPGTRRLRFFCVDSVPSALPSDESS
jgi:predicted transcriptional regulator